MRRDFWKASLISLLVYTLAILLGIWIDLRVTLLVIPVFQLAWMTFCSARIIQLRRSGGHEVDALPDERASYDFSVGGLVSSCVMLLAIVVLSQVVTNTPR